jgi:hypothetical protein
MVASVVAEIRPSTLASSFAAMTRGYPTSGFSTIVATPCPTPTQSAAIP